jgi:heme a synthase
MTALRRYAYVALGIACLHLVFGAIVRITGSGMGCGNSWPRCNGYWIPPLDQPTLIVEVTHRYLASLLIAVLGAFGVAAWRRRRDPGVAGRGGVLRMTAAAVVVALCVALLGALTVKLGNTTWATVGHWTLAMTLLAVIAVAGIRAGALGGVSARVQHVLPRTARAARAAAVLAFVTVAMGGITAKYSGASVACLEFPLCGRNPDVAARSVGVQVTHRILALLLLLHLFGMIMAGRKRHDAPVVRRALYVAFGFVVAQFGVAGAMIGVHLPPSLRSLHEAVGVGVWLSTFTFAYLARVAVGWTPLDRGDALSQGAPLPPRSPKTGAGRRELAGTETTL